MILRVRALEAVLVTFKLKAGSGLEAKRLGYMPVTPNRAQKRIAALEANQAFHQLVFL
jgi:hypothetical protein